MVIITATSSDGTTDIGEPTTPEQAKEIISLLDGRFNIKYSIIEAI